VPGYFDIQELCAGRTAHRKGIATILARDIPRIREIDRLLPLVEKLLADPDKNVREIVARMFWQGDLYGKAVGGPLLRLLVQSPALLENLFPVMHGLHETTARLDQYFESIEVIVDRASAAPDAHAPHYLGNVLFQLYEQCAPRSAAQRRCLDIIDISIRDRLAYELLKRIE
jgi:hypothetical protein